jgi:hypothetical protein
VVRSCVVGILPLARLPRTPLKRSSTAKGIASVRSTGHLRTVAPNLLGNWGYADFRRLLSRLSRPLSALT